MEPLYLKISDDQLVYGDQSDLTNGKVYKFNSELDPQKNLNNFKKEIAKNPDVLVITNEPESSLKKTAVAIDGNLIDAANVLENVFHSPVVTLEDANESNLEKAANKEREYSQWHLDYYGLDHKKRQYGQESMQTIGNGYLGLRGTYLDAKANNDYYPATYVAGVFNQLTTPINGRGVLNEDMVNLPNAQYITFSVGNENFKLSDQTIQESLRSLNMQDATMTISMLVELNDGKKLRVVEKKVADLKNYHNYYLQYNIEPLNFSDKITIHTEIDADIQNSNVERYRDLASKHLDVDQINLKDNDAALNAHTSQSKVNIAIRTHISQNIAGATLADSKSDKVAKQDLTFDAKQGQTYKFEKAVGIFTSLETKDLQKAYDNDNFLENFATAEKNAAHDWQEIWDNQDVKITSDVTAQKLVRLNEYSMTIAAQENANKDLDASVGSRGLTGEGYRGHIFWDEVFDIDFYILHYPELVKNLLMYRYNRLGAALKNAKGDNQKGAMYPWQSAMYGDEQAQLVHLNPITNKWDPDNSRKQRHVSLAIAYNIINYFNISEDEEFMKKYGLKMLLEITKFWIGMTTYDSKNKIYSIDNVMGPDEFHEGYPGAKESGLNNNAYTNIMVSWLFKQIMKLNGSEPKAVLNDNFKATDFSADDLKKTDDIRHHLKLDFKGDILGQFDGYFDLQQLNLDDYKKKYGDISRIDRILKAHNDTPDKYQVSKQADTLMALFNLREDDFLDIMKDLGHPIADPNKFMSDNIDFYLARTTHGSTLSRVVYSTLALKDNNQDLAWTLFYQALTSDYYDIQGGTTAEGIHLGVMGATCNIVTSYFAGVDYRGSELTINPDLPKQWTEISFPVTFKGAKYNFDVTSDTVTAVADKDTQVNLRGKEIKLVANEPQVLKY